MKRITIIICALSLVLGVGAQDNKTKVFITSGAKYHLSDSCQYVKNSPTKKAVTLADAQKQGKTLCKRCESKAKKKTTKK